MDTVPLPCDRKPRIAIIANPAAGSTTRTHVASVASLCTDFAEEVGVFWTQRRGHATEFLGELLQQEATVYGHPDVLVSVGGDGTLREVVDGVRRAPHRPPLMVLPGGTGNSNYRFLWDDMPWDDALRAALSGAAGAPRPLDLARIDAPERLVVLGVSTGLFAAATALSRSIATTGRDRYQEAISRTLAEYRPYPGRVLVEGRVVHEGATTLVNVGGGRHRAGVYDILPHSRPDDGLLDVCVLDASLPVEDALALLRSGAHVGRAGVVYARGAEVTLERVDGSPLHFESDGEVVESDRPAITVEVLPGAVPVFTNGRHPGPGDQS
ncbi:diacylglycerol/lipid kinase family protein [Streptomyces sp. AN091965]|uniref:diacylglycerol/lipid kinase family protein n=1 Tax=Streptomyces sp. AN091965 TaxID=2927803 RepID=UPI001F6020F2|nr:diacylglycerol kinase family protein [Streptomyces sp. AN091965]MCI3935076.1 VlmJ-like protein [Streptomyces sp. AN091965]